MNYHGCSHEFFRWIRMGIYFSIVICLHMSFLTYSFSYDSAIYTAQKGDMKSADEQLKRIVVDAPDSADVLYDAGFIAHGLNNFSQAIGYFNRAAECAHNNKDLCFRAHFNAGNACVDNKNLQCALEQYDKALAIEPDNEYARHNRDRVAQMLQEQETQQDQQKNQDQKEEQKDNKDEDQQKQDQQAGNDDEQQQDDSKNDQQQSDDQQEQNQKNNTSGNQSDQKDNGEQRENYKESDKGSHGEQKRDAENKQQQSTNNKERDREQDLNKESDDAQNGQDEQHSKPHGQSPDKQDGTQDKTSVTAGDKQEQGKDGNKNNIAEACEQDDCKKLAQKIDDPWLMGILNNQEMRDKEINKQLMEAKIRQHGGKNGQNCW